MNMIEKQFQKQEKRKNSSIRKWYQKNKHIVFFYIWIPVVIYDKHKDARYKNLKYSNDTTKKYLDRVMPKLVSHYEESPDNILFINIEDFGGIRFYWDLCSNWMERNFKKERRYFLKFNEEVQNYIIQEYHIDGYEKMVLNGLIDWNKAKEKFDWYGTPYNADYVKGAVFYKEL